MKKTNTYVKMDDNTIVNESCIRWVTKVSECLEVCSKPTGCAVGVDTRRICKLYNPLSYEKLNKHFAE